MKTIIQPPPNHQPRDRVQRLLEFTVGILPFAFLALIIILSRFYITAAAALLLAYTTIWLVRILGYGKRLLKSLYYVKLADRIDWQEKLSDIKNLEQPALENKDFLTTRAEKWYAKSLASGIKAEKRPDPYEIYHAIIVAIYNEPAGVIESTVESITESRYDLKKITLILSYEERGGKNVEAVVKKIAEKYKGQFKLAAAVKHPDGMPGEAQAKAGNITYAAKFLTGYFREHNIAADKILVTTLDADNRPHPQYLAGLTWMYCMAASRTKRSYQPIPLFVNNIWEVPAVVRVVAADSSFWFMMESLRPQRLRLFSAYAQSLKTLQDVDYWNVETIVEDGHQYWRAYFTFRGDHYVLPVWLPVWQDAVLDASYRKTLAAQFRQLLRWSWGVADVPFVVRQAFKDNSISWTNKLVHIFHLVDDYIAWSTAPIILAIGGWLPFLIGASSRQSFLALKLPYFVSGLQLLALVVVLVPIVASFLSLPPRPAHVSRAKNLEMLLQWLLEPVALIGFISSASLAAHLRLIFNKPLEKFHVTTKARTE